MNSNEARLKHLASLCTTITGSEARPYVALENIESWTGELVAHKTVEIREPGDGNGIASVEPGDVLFGKLRPYLAKTWVADRPAYASTELLCMRPVDGVDSRWLGYVSLSQPFVRWAVATSDGTKMPRTSWEKMGSYRIRPPRVAEQRAIADFLDAETARIDALITKKSRMIELVDQWEQRSLLKAVGDWRRGSSMSLRQYGTQVLTGPFGSVLSADEYVEGGVPLINPSHIYRGRLEPDPSVSVSESVAERLGRYRLRAGDIVMGRKGDVGRAAVIPRSADGWLCGSDSIVIRVGKGLSSAYLATALRVSLYRQQLAMHSTGATLANVNEGVLLSLRLRTVSLEDQLASVNRALRINEAADRLVERLTRQIDLLAERRQALITGAVTGELDIARTIVEEAS